LSDWIAKLPDSIQNKSITVLRLKFWILAFSGRIENGEPLFENIDHLLTSLEQPTSLSAQSIKGEVLIFRGIQAHYRFKFDQGIEYCEHALELIPEIPQTSITRGLAFYVLGDLFREKGEFGKAEEKFLATDKIPLDYKSRIQTKWCLAVIANIRGQLRVVAKLYEEAYAIANTYGLNPGTISMADIGMSELMYERNKVQTAHDLLSASIGNVAWTKTLNWWENPSVIVPGYALLARILHALGQRETALEVVNLGCKMCEDYDVFPDFVSMMQAEKIHLWLAQGYFDQAFKWMQENPYNLDDTFDYLHEPERIAFARGLIEHAKRRVISFETTVDFLNSLADAAEAGKRFGRLIEILNLQALALYSLGNVDGSHKLLRKSLTLAQPEGHMRIFLDEGKPMNQLLKGTKESELDNNPKNYVNRLLEAFTSEASLSTTNREREGLWKH
jgi:LuxR family maltose regulon positive regulatory protein